MGTGGYIVLAAAALYALGFVVMVLSGWNPRARSQWVVGGGIVLVVLAVVFVLGGA